MDIDMASGISWHGLGPLHRNGNCGIYYIGNGATRRSQTEKYHNKNHSGKLHASMKFGSKTFFLKKDYLPADFVSYCTTFLQTLCRAKKPGRAFPTILGMWVPISCTMIGCDPKRSAPRAWSPGQDIASAQFRPPPFFFSFFSFFF